ncbi:MAG: hypothetical protein A2Y62_06775 [Candidatus Fischerbacteria bacterium RBG_13_37_8]|uniref:UPF0102 protein A2Y62_06775 n=1 Tax=Candidatus Fischerbacteria bacterium RBG_13_37_8 TaxID=1817863 RepID=A0A1F5VNG0_9BACT|nr:MAG: hypothetical protein A2Y62_06775 [Candidatus Fischerbacteria bacterium RBG_13_37_8]
MESSPKKFGDYGETLAVNFLKKHGYTIIQRNYKCIYGEIDIIAKENNCIVFIEVKTRKTGGEILPEDSINYAKERRLTKAAEYYINGLDYYDGDFRFDVVSIIVNNNKPQITIITDAF